MSPETTANLKSKKTIPWQKIGQYSILLLLVVLFVWLVKSFLDGNFNSIESFQEYIQGFGIFGPIILIFVQLSQVVLPISSGCCRLRGRLHPVWLAGRLSVQLYRNQYRFHFCLLSGQKIRHFFRPAPCIRCKLRKVCALDAEKRIFSGF